MKTETQKGLGAKNPMGLLMIFFSSVGIGYALISQFFYNKPKIEILAVMVCLLVAGIASRLREKYSK